MKSRNLETENWESKKNEVRDRMVTMAVKTTKN